MKPTHLLASTAAATLVAAFLLGSAAPDAHARPEYAKKEGKECSFCHVNPKGGGPRNAKGDEYAKNGHKFLAQGFGQDAAFSSEANGKAFDLVQKAISFEHWSDALTRIKDLKSKEKKGAAAQLLLNTEGQVDGKGRDLAKTAKESVTSGKAKEASEALLRVEVEFKGRDAAKDAPKIRSDVEKLAGGKEALEAARTLETQRVAWLDAEMKEAAGDAAGAIRALTDLLAKFPDGPYATDAKTKLDALKAAAPAGMKESETGAGGGAPVTGGRVSGYRDGGGDEADRLVVRTGRSFMRPSILAAVAVAFVLSACCCGPCGPCPPPPCACPPPPPPCACPCPPP